MVASGPGERLPPEDGTQRFPESWTGCLLPAKGRWCQGQEEVSYFVLNTHGVERCVREELSSNRICDRFNVSLVG